MHWACVVIYIKTNCKTCTGKIEKQWLWIKAGDLRRDLSIKDVIVFLT